MKRVKLSDIASKAGVSNASVSAFFSGKFYGDHENSVIGIGAEARLRIIQAARELSYQPVSYEKQVLLYPEKASICFLISSQVPEGFANPYFSRVLNGALEGSVSTREIVLSRFDVTKDYLREQEEIPKSIRENRLSAVLLMGAPNPKFMKAMENYDLPVFYLSRVVEGAQVYSFVPDYRSAGRMATEYLVSKGHTAIEVISPIYWDEETYQVVRFASGVQDAWAKSKGAFAPCDIRFSGTVDQKKLCAYLKRAMNRKKRPTAFFCLDDLVAVRLWRAAESIGLKVPQDISIVGCNDGRTEPEMAQLTTIRLPAEELAHAAIQQVFESLVDSAFEFSKLTTLPVELVERSSVATI